MSIDRLIVGLGNPGPRYAPTRHNLGFMIVDELARHFEASWQPQTKFMAHTADISTNDHRILLVKPQTFMNLSGQAVGKLMQFYKLAPTDVWVICDDIDQPLGNVRVRQGGSSGGQKGVESILDTIGQDFWRFRVGIGQNDRQIISSEDYVLQKFSNQQLSLLDQIVTNVASLVSRDISSNGPEATTHQAISAS